LIKLREVYFNYNKEPVVKGVSLSLGNECIALAGPNGAGKTTILKLMAGIYRPKKGEVFIEGKNIWKLPEKEAITLRRKVVYVHENPIVLRGSVLNNVIFGLELRGVSKEEARKKALKLMRKLGIDELAEKDAKNLSAGQAQLLALARALIVEPSYMLLDEPMANLDWKRRKSVLELLKELKETGRSIAIATHDAFLVSLVCSKAYIIENGSVVSETLPPAIFQ